MEKINYNKCIWEGWTVQDFINELAPQIEMIMAGNSWQKPFSNKTDLKEYCMQNQPYYKKHVPDVVNYFAQEYNIK